MAVAAVRTAASLVPTVRLEDLKPDGDLPSGRLSVTKPSWVVRTESNVRKAKREKPDPPCVVCRGSGKLDCHRCHGKGRTNCVQLVILPKGEWPKWCKACGGNGLAYCHRCLGTGEYRGAMGFRFVGPRGMGIMHKAPSISRPVSSKMIQRSKKN